MRTDLNHLPAAKQRELERVVQILFEEFEDANCLALGKRKAGRIQKIILYGSYARGGWVDEPHTAKGYKSDFDLLIIVNQKNLTDHAHWEKAEDRFTRELSITKTLQTPVNFIVHTLQEVNDGLAHGRYFFIDVANDGVALYQADDSELHRPKPKTAKEALAMANEYFEEWMPAATDFTESARFLISKGRYKRAAFLLHQATESLYHGALLVCNSYTPHVHNLGFLRTQAERLDFRLFNVWPRDTRAERAMFEKLKDAYVKARYSKHFTINNDELIWLGAQVEELGRVVHIVCSEKIASLEAATI